MPTDEIYEGRLQALQSRDDEIKRLRALGAEMLETLRLVLKRLGELNRDDEAGMRMVLANAIAKAEGNALKTAE